MTIYEYIFIGSITYAVMSGLFITLRHWRKGLQVEHLTEIPTV